VLGENLNPVVQLIGAVGLIAAVRHNAAVRDCSVVRIAERLIESQIGHAMSR